MSPHFLCPQATVPMRTSVPLILHTRGPPLSPLHESLRTWMFRFGVVNEIIILENLFSKKYKMTFLLNGSPFFGTLDRYTGVLLLSGERRIPIGHQFVPYSNGCLGCIFLPLRVPLGHV